MFRQRWTHLHKQYLSSGSGCWGSRYLAALALQIALSGSRNNTVLAASYRCYQEQNSKAPAQLTQGGFGSRVWSREPILKVCVN